VKDEIDDARHAVAPEQAAVKPRDLVAYPGSEVIAANRESRTWGRMLQSAHVAAAGNVGGQT